MERDACGTARCRVTYLFGRTVVEASSTTMISRRIPGGRDRRARYARSRDRGCGIVDGDDERNGGRHATVPSKPHAPGARDSGGNSPQDSAGAARRACERQIRVAASQYDGPELSVAGEVGKKEAALGRYDCLSAFIRTVLTYDREAEKLQ